MRLQWRVRTLLDAQVLSYGGPPHAPHHWEMEMEEGEKPSTSGDGGSMFTLKKWHAVAMWSWDVECDTCAICRLQLMEACLRCQGEGRGEECVVVWGECNHSFHNCCLSLWVKHNNRCPLCQKDWFVQRTGH